jgi:cytochrome P450
VAHRDHVDFVRSFAVPLPVRVIAAGLAVPDDRVDDFKRWSDAAVAGIGAQLSEDEMLESARGTSELWNFVLEQIERKRRDPGSDVVSSLVHARLTDDETVDLEGGVARQLSNDEIFSIVRQLLVAATRPRPTC